MKLIDKDKVVAEIERRIKEIRPQFPLFGKIPTLKGVLSFLDTIEVKDVDLEKEVETYMNLHNLRTQDGGRIVFENGDTPNFWCDFRDIAEYFFELGLKAQKGK